MSKKKKKYKPYTLREIKEQITKMKEDEKNRNWISVMSKADADFTRKNAENPNLRSLTDFLHHMRNEFETEGKIPKGLKSMNVRPATYYGDLLKDFKPKNRGVLYECTLKFELSKEEYEKLFGTESKEVWLKELFEIMRQCAEFGRIDTENFRARNHYLTDTLDIIILRDRSVSTRIVEAKDIHPDTQSYLRELRNVKPISSLLGKQMSNNHNPFEIETNDVIYVAKQNIGKYEFLEIKIGNSVYTF